MTARAGKAAAARPGDDEHGSVDVRFDQKTRSADRVVEAEPQSAADRARGHSTTTKESKMVSSIERAVTRIRHDLRERLLDESHVGVADLLEGFEAIAAQVGGDIGNDLRNEAERWRLRFEMLAALQALAEEMNEMREAA